jgi:hypothetical protein
MNALPANRSLSLALAPRCDAAAAYSDSLLCCRACERCSRSAAHGSLVGDRAPCVGIISLGSRWSVWMPSGADPALALGRRCPNRLAPLALALPLTPPLALGRRCPLPFGRAPGSGTSGACERRCERAGRRGDWSFEMEERDACPETFRRLDEGGGMGERASRSQSRASPLNLALALVPRPRSARLTASCDGLTGGIEYGLRPWDCPLELLTNAG